MLWTAVGLALLAAVLMLANPKPIASIRIKLVFLNFKQEGGELQARFHISDIDDLFKLVYSGQETVSESVRLKYLDASGAWKTKTGIPQSLESALFASPSESAPFFSLAVPTNALRFKFEIENEYQRELRLFGIPIFRSQIAAIYCFTEEIEVPAVKP